MATKPTDRILDWASGGTATDPGAGKEATGWLVSERPPAFWWNWILSSFGQWLTYLDTRVDYLPLASVRAFNTPGVVACSIFEEDNVTGVDSADDTSGAFSIDFTDATTFDASTYHVQVTSHTQGIVFHVAATLPGSCGVVATTASTGTAVNLSTTACTFSLNCRGVAP